MLCRTDAEMEVLRLRKQRLHQLHKRAKRLAGKECATVHNAETSSEGPALWKLHCEENVPEEAFFNSTLEGCNGIMQVKE